MDFDRYTAIFGTSAPPPLTTFQSVERETDALVPTKVETRYNLLTMSSDTVVTYRTVPSEESRLTKAYQDALTAQREKGAEYREAIQKASEAGQALDDHVRSKGR